MNFEKLGKKLNRMNRQSIAQNLRQMLIYGGGAFLALFIVEAVPFLTSLFAMIGIGTTAFVLYKIFSK